MKTRETKDLESALALQTEEGRIYGCEEITIGFQRNGFGKEIRDFRR